MPKVNVLPELHNWIKEEAKKNRRTIQGQVEVLLELAKREIEQEEKIKIGKTQIDMDAIRGE